MAEAVFAHKVRTAGLENKIHIDSAGTGHWHVGEPPHAGTQRILKQNGVAHSHRARLLTRGDLNDFDYILTMDEMNLQDVQALGSGKAKIAPLLEYAPHTGFAEVPDPYYNNRFEEVYALVDAAGDGLLAEIRREHAL